VAEITVAEVDFIPGQNWFWA